MTTHLRLMAALLALLLFAAACGDDDPVESGDADDTGSDAATNPPDEDDADEPSATDDEAEQPEESTATPTEPAAPTWVQHVPDPDEGCICSDGSEFSYWSRTASTDKVVLYYQGGGACFTAEMCSFTDGMYSVTASGPGDGGGGIFDFDNPDNPFADWSFVFVPYCTGDVHIGNAVHEYSDDLTVNHVGFLNASKGLDHVVENFPDAGEIVVTGSSAGGVPSPLFGGLASDAFPDASITVLADASGAYPDNPPINAAIGSLWGTFENVPDWPVNEGLVPEDWSIPGLFTQAGLHDPDIRMARFDNAYDNVQQSFAAMAAFDTDDLLTVIQANEAAIEADGVPVSSYIAPGDDHTILVSDNVYALEVDGVSFLDWLTRYVEGEAVEDVVCTECDKPEPPA